MTADRAIPAGTTPAGTSWNESPGAPRKRAAMLLTTEQYVLRQWGGNLRNAFPEAMGILHVGSSITRRDYRDVDVRIVLDDADFDQLAKVTDVRVLAVALSIWGQQYTRLPIDCQVQRYSEQKDDPNPRRSIGGLPMGPQDDMPEPTHDATEVPHG